MDDLLRLTEALDDAARAREITALPSGWVRVSTGLFLFDGTGVDVYVRFLPDGQVRVSDLAMASAWLLVCDLPDGQSTMAAMDALAPLYGMTLAKHPHDGGWGITAPWSGVAAAVDRVASFQVAVGGLAHGVLTPLSGEAG